MYCQTEAASTEGPLELEPADLARVGGGATKYYEVNPPSAVDYIWSGHGPLYQEIGQTLTAHMPSSYFA